MRNRDGSLAFSQPKIRKVNYNYKDQACWEFFQIGHKINIAETQRSRLNKSFANWLISQFSHSFHEGRPLIRFQENYWVLIYSGVD